MNLWGNSDTHTSSLVNQTICRTKERDRGMLAPGSDKCKCPPCSLFAVGNPDVLHLRGMLEEPASFRQFRVEPVDDATLICPDLLEVAGGHRFRRGDGSFVAVTPQTVHVVMLCKSFQKLGGVAGDNIHGAAGHIAGIEQLVEVAGDEWILLRGNCNDRVAYSEQGQHQRKEAEKRGFARTDHPHGANRLIHRDRNITEGWVVH